MKFKLSRILVSFLILLAPTAGIASTGCNYPASLDSWTDKVAGDFWTVADVNQARCGIEKLMTGPLAPNKSGAAGPAYTFQGDNDTGMDSLGVNQVSLITNGVERFRVTNSGITVGTWAATAIGSQFGGSGANLSACAQGAVPYFNATGVEACLGPDTAGKMLQTNGAAANPTFVTPAVSKSFASSPQTITAAGSLTIAHGLGATPPLVQWELVCGTGELGYTAGDIYKGSFAQSGAGSNHGIGIVPDATNLNIRFGSNASVFAIVHKTTGVVTNITPANWTIVFRAYL